jgi:hypothetical protein
MSIDLIGFNYVPRHILLDASLAPPSTHSLNLSSEADLAEKTG